MQADAVYTQDVVLLGGGHSHALLLKMWAMDPLPGVRLTLVSDQIWAAYSGMLPGLIAGHYDFEQAHIDLHKLTLAAGARFIHAKACGVDPVKRQVQLAQRPPLDYDLLSINTGITPSRSIPGSGDTGFAVKPVASLWQRWQTLLENDAGDDAPWVVVGGGAAGVELCLAIQQGLAHHNKKRDLILIQLGSGLPEAYPNTLQAHMAALFGDRGIAVKDNCEVIGARQDQLQLRGPNGIEILPCGEVFWCTPGTGPEWLAATQIGDADGFVPVTDTLQAPQFPGLFAAGDIARIQGHSLPRAGVFAVRQAPVLFHNIRAACNNKPLQRFRPQSAWLSLLSTADGHAMGCRLNSGWPTLSGAWVWHWKNWIDRRFMAQFEDLPPLPMPVTAPAPNDDPMRCGGCAAKVSGDVLTEALASLPGTGDSHRKVLGGDAANLAWPTDAELIQSIDVVRPLLDDPYINGAIAAEHALNDLYAAGATPHSALAYIALPQASDTLTGSDLRQTLLGALSVLQRQSCQLAGGHSAELRDAAIGFTVNGYRTGAQDALEPSAGDCLILNKPLGIGALFAARQYGAISATMLDAAISTMLLSNAEAVPVFHRFDARACTDITGFGLAGHVRSMLSSSQRGARLWVTDIPRLAGVTEVFSAGIRSTLHDNNRRFAKLPVDADPILSDPQTAGGLCAVVSREQAELCVEALREAGYPAAAIIGEVTAEPEFRFGGAPSTSADYP